VRSTGPVTHQKHGLSSAAGHIPGKRFFIGEISPESKNLQKLNRKLSDFGGF
jgi:hypothetical protein